MRNRREKPTVSQKIHVQVGDTHNNALSYYNSSCYIDVRPILPDTTGCYCVTSRGNIMAKSNAERQAEYRIRHLKNDEGKGELLNMVIDLHAKRALERLAKCYGVTQRQMLERLALQEERSCLDKIAQVPNGHSDYYEGKLRMETADVTP